MRNKPFPAIILSALAGVLAVTVGMTSPKPASAEEIISLIARGGLLYDKWYTVTGADKPTKTHPAWPDGNTKKKGSVTWHCTSCHGWDYKGKDGPFGSKGSAFYTGIKGIRGMMGASVEKITSILMDETHGYTDDMLEPEDFRDLSLFVSQGLIDMDYYIDRETKKPRGIADWGEPIYNTICARCHEFDGSKPKDMGETLGKQAEGDPWMILHNIMNGHPGEKMPSLRAFDRPVAVNVLTYLTTLPKE